MTNKKEQLFRAIDFADIEPDIVKVSQKYFEYWQSLRGQGGKYDEKELAEDFKRGFTKSVDIFWDPKHRNPEACTQEDLRLIKEVTGGELNKIWNNRYMESLTEDQMYDPKFQRVLCNYFNDSVIKKFIIRNKDKFPVIPKSRFKMKSYLSVLIFKIRYYLMHREWPWWIR